MALEILCVWHISGKRVVLIISLFETGSPFPENEAAKATYLVSKLVLYSKFRILPFQLSFDTKRAQFTSQAFSSLLEQHRIKVSMDGKGRYTDNLFIERLWRSLKYEEVYLKAYAGGKEARAGIGEYFDFYNLERPHQVLGYRTPKGSQSARLGRVMEIPQQQNQ